MNFSFLKSPKYGGNTKNMKFIVRKININENRLYYGDFDQKQIFQKKKVKNSFRICGVGDVFHISEMCFSPTLVSELSLKKISDDLKNIFF